MKKFMKVVKSAALRIGVFLLVLATPVGILMSFNANERNKIAEEQGNTFYEQYIGEKGLKLDEQRRNAVIQVNNQSVDFKAGGKNSD
ncbi:hypothetical protein CN692_00560 [Bacillus sp. AFS002410]|uniref:hypothetical protein n=1 Tax=Bacillus sp. AFS002410 TaxID=2033481 RepID=UPI000BF23658|nr:hypothetical protein [Bacillus sp. AFS002410]PEJ60616.1 hypothetical protein CN692_00560 [Bacillus sp. AFS002410]